MNYLAHFALSHPNEAYMVGNFLADLLPKNLPLTLSEKIEKGIMIHRKIDAFTDTHQAVLDSKKLFGRGFRRFSGILLDIYYDFLLSKYWNEFYTLPKSQMIADAYRILEAHQDLFQTRASRFSKILQEEDLLHAYGTLEGVGLALKRIDMRLRKPCGLHEGLDELLKNSREIEMNFLHFYPQLMTYVNTLDDDYVSNIVV